MPSYAPPVQLAATMPVQPIPATPAAAVPVQPRTAAAANNVMPTAPASARAPGTDQSKGDDYAMLRELTRRHVDLLATSFLSGRRGTTLLRILVLRDGTIARLSIAQGSGYPDVDERIEQMVTAVGRFPPLPAAFQGPSADLQLKLMFPNALEQ
jgi:TonB family protein